MVRRTENAQIIRIFIVQMSLKRRPPQINIILDLLNIMEQNISTLIPNHPLRHSHPSTHQPAQTALSLLLVWDLCRFRHPNQRELFLERLHKGNDIHQQDGGSQPAALLFFAG